MSTSHYYKTIDNTSKEDLLDIQNTSHFTSFEIKQPKYATCIKQKNYKLGKMSSFIKSGKEIPDFQREEKFINKPGLHPPKMSSIFTNKSNALKYKQGFLELMKQLKKNKTKLKSPKIPQTSTNFISKTLIKTLHTKTQESLELPSVDSRSRLKPSNLHTPNLSKPLNLRINAYVTPPRELASYKLIQNSKSGMLDTHPYQDQLITKKKLTKGKNQRHKFLDNRSASNLKQRK